MLEHEIRIRIAGEGLGFVYSIWRAGKLIETAEVPPVGEPLCEAAAYEVDPGYYGGSVAMD
jgi:hypothetical protein